MKKNEDIILNKVKEYYINTKKLIKDYQKQFRESKTDEQKQKMKEYQKNIKKIGLMNKNKNEKITKKNIVQKKLNKSYFITYKTRD